MALWMLCGYVVLAAVFYLIVVATASNTAVPALMRHTKWLRPRKIKPSALFRRLRKRQ